MLRVWKRGRRDVGFLGHVSCVSKPLSKTHLESGGRGTQRTLRPEESLEHDGGWRTWSWVEAKSESQSFWPRMENPIRA